MIRMLFRTAGGANYLIALAFGYIVCYLAHREEKPLGTIGYVIGIFIVLVSGIVILGKIYDNLTIHGLICGIAAK